MKLTKFRKFSKRKYEEYLQKWNCNEINEANDNKTFRLQTID